MTPEQQLKQGDLQGALGSLEDKVRNNPWKVEFRTFLFQLLAICGQWDRALAQLKVAADLDEIALPMFYTYREVIQCEALRESVFRGEREPLIFGEPQDWIITLIKALILEGQGPGDESQRLRRHAFDAAPASEGEINGQKFSWMADGDARLGPILEVILEGRYFWVPFKQIRSIRVDPPADLRDLVWLPARFTWVNEGESIGLIPTRYPESYWHEDASIALCRKTEWASLGNDNYRGYGQRILITDGCDFPLMDIRGITLGQPESTAMSATNG